MKAGFTPDWRVEQGGQDDVLGPRDLRHSSLAGACVDCSHQSSGPRVMQGADTRIVSLNHDPTAGTVQRGSTATSSSLPPALPRSSVPATAPDPAAISTPLGLADLEQIAMQRNPTLRQAAAQYEAALSRSFQAGLYPNPVIGYVQDQIGSFSESRPSSSGFSVKGKPSPGDNVGAFVQQQIVTAGKLRFSRAKFVEEANAARWQALCAGIPRHQQRANSVLRGPGRPATDRDPPRAFAVER